MRIIKQNKRALYVIGSVLVIIIVSGVAVGLWKHNQKQSSQNDAPIIMLQGVNEDPAHREAEGQATAPQDELPQSQVEVNKVACSLLEDSQITSLIGSGTTQQRSEVAPNAEGVFASECVYTRGNDKVTVKAYTYSNDGDAKKALSSIALNDVKALQKNKYIVSVKYEQSGSLQAAKAQSILDVAERKL